MDVTAEQVRRLRVARHGLAERTTDLAAAASLGLQDTPPGAAAVALAARWDLDAADAPDGHDLLGSLRDGRAGDALVLVPSLRGAPFAIVPADLRVFTDGVAPPDEAAAAVQLGNAPKTLEIPSMEALDRVSSAVRDALNDGPLPRDDFHQALRDRLPPDLLHWCKGCESHHVHPSLWRATGVRGVLAIVGREGRSAVFGAPPDPPRGPKDPGAELARRYLRANGPSTPKLLTDWLGTSKAHAAALWERAGELTEVRVDGTKRWLLAEDAETLADPPEIRGVRLVTNLDPIATARDRELLVPDADVRKRIWTILGGPGIVLQDGEVAGTWRAAKKGRRLVVTVEALKRLRKRDLATEAQRIAPARGAETAEVVEA